MNELNFLDSILNDVMDNGIYTNCTGSTPRVDVIENKTSYVLEMELPGRTENDITLELDNDNLTIASADKKEEKAKDKKDGPNYLLRERRSSSFSRSFTLPKDADLEAIEANFKNGILTVSIAKKAAVEPKKILIQAA